MKLHLKVTTPKQTFKRADGCVLQMLISGQTFLVKHFWSFKNCLLIQTTVRDWHWVCTFVTCCRLTYQKNYALSVPRSVGSMISITSSSSMHKTFHISSSSTYECEVNPCWWDRQWLQQYIEDRIRTRLLVSWLVTNCMDTSCLAKILKRLKKM